MTSNTPSVFTWQSLSELVNTVLITDHHSVVKHKHIHTLRPTLPGATTSLTPSRIPLRFSWSHETSKLEPSHLGRQGC